MYVLLAQSEVNKDFIYFFLFIHRSCVLEAMIDC
jgi:hypothetical protein